MKKFGLIAAAIAMVASAPAVAEPITLSNTSIGSSFAVDFNGFTGSGTIDGLLGSALFTLTGTTANSYTFSYAVTNESASPITTSRISGFGFNTNPEISGASSTGTFAQTATDSNVPNIGTVDVCFKGGGGSKSCAGGGGGGVNLGQTGTGTLTLNFGSPLTSLTLDDFFVRYQSITGAGSTSSAVGSGTAYYTSGGTTTGGTTTGGTTTGGTTTGGTTTGGTTTGGTTTGGTTTGGTTTGGTTTGGTPVPEPAMIGLFGLGLMGLAMRRRKQLVHA